MIKRLRQEAPGGLVPVLLLISIGLAPLVEIANSLAPPLLPAAARAGLLEFLVAALCLAAVFVSVRHAWRVNLPYAWQRTPFPFLLILFCWSIFCLVRSPYPDFAFAEWLRIVFCLMMFVVAAYGLRPGQIQGVISGMIALGAGIAMDGLLQFGAARTGGETDAFGYMFGLFGDSENFGSFLMILLPLAIRQAFDRENPETLRLGVQAAALIMLIALAVNCTRSAWIGEVFALSIMGLLTVRSEPSMRKVRRRYWLIPTAAAAAVLAALIVGGSTMMVSHRALSLTHAARLYSFTDRKRKSEAALHMAAARPWTGWGLGAWSVTQQRWTGEGDTPAQVFARHDLWSRGGDQQSLAHDFYAQWAAETGAAGLCLYAAALGTFFFFSLRRLPKIRSQQARGILISCVAAAAAGCLDAFTSPAYNFPGVSGVLWLSMGLGTAAGLEA